MRPVCIYTVSALPIDIRRAHHVRAPHPPQGPGDQDARNDHHLASAIAPVRCPSTLLPLPPPRARPRLPPCSAVDPSLVCIMQLGSLRACAPTEGKQLARIRLVDKQRTTRCVWTGRADKSLHLMMTQALASPTVEMRNHLSWVILTRPAGGRLMVHRRLWIVPHACCARAGGNSRTNLHEKALEHSCNFEFLLRGLTFSTSVLQPAAHVIDISHFRLTSHMNNHPQMPCDHVRWQLFHHARHLYPRGTASGSPEPSFPFLSEKGTPGTNSRDSTSRPAASPPDTDQKPTCDLHGVRGRLIWGWQPPASGL